VCHIHGLADQNVPFGGGVGRGRAQDSRPSVESVVANWATVDGCGPASERVDGGVHSSTSVGPHGRAVTLLTIDGAGHQWPGSQPPPARVVRALGIDPPSTALDATSVLWQFFAAHPRTQDHSTNPPAISM
jgi:polyhydroxybutyrate depolymerase